ncbi:uncharacterized protein LOC135435973 isoform X2 [Drosophila montana]|uniref:uncharacterized protein LOC135435973 isoform X2 n=1 Tax=Drosophila montana TaxID=40370 RepID=UPI00313D7401
MENAENNKELNDIDIENTQHICLYLRNLRNRLKQTIQQHTDLIQTSVNIIREMADVSTMLAMSHCGTEQQPTKIKRLIMEFENMHTGDNGLSSIEATELRELLADFRRLHESQLLRDSLMCFKRAKESFEKVDTLLGQSVQTGVGGSGHPSPQSSQAVVGSNSASRSLREKILAFNKASEKGQNMLQNFTHCFSKTSSTNIVPAGETQANPNASRSRTNSGYEGDVDSEVDQSDVKSKEQVLKHND